MCSSKRERGKFCGMKSVNIDRLDKLVWDETSGIKLHIKAVLQELKNDEVRNSRLIANQQQITFLDSHLSLLNTRKENLLNVYLSGQIPLDLFTKKNNEIVSEEEKHYKKKYELQAEVLALQTPTNLLQAGFELEQMFFRKANPTTEEKRKMLLALVHNIEVDFDEASKMHTVKILLNMEKQSIVRHMEVRLKKSKGTTDPEIAFGDYKRIDDILTDGKIWHGTEESVYVKLFPPVVTESRRWLYNERGVKSGLLSYADGMCLVLTYEMKNITGAYHKNSRYSLLTRELRAYA